MRPIYENTVVQVELTNACHLSCANCTRHLGHHRNPFFMDLETFEKAVKSLVDFPGRVGVMGGEPMMHPKFDEITAIYRKYIPRRRREFWTAGFKWAEKKDVIYETWDRDRINYNDHIAYDGKHQHLLVALDDVVDDEQWKAELIDNCGFANHWSASITPKGAFFCEIAASLDWLFDGPGGFDIEPGWWDKSKPEFQGQIDEYCGKCSGALPMPTYSDGRGGRDANPDVISPSNIERLKAQGSRKVLTGNYETWDKKITRADAEALKDWSPRSFRTFVARNPEDVEREIAHV